MCSLSFSSFQASRALCTWGEVLCRLRVWEWHDFIPPPPPVYYSIRKVRSLFVVLIWSVLCSLILHYSTFQTIVLWHERFSIVFCYVSVIDDLTTFSYRIHVHDDKSRAEFTEQSTGLPGCRWKLTRAPFFTFLYAESENGWCIWIVFPPFSFFMWFDFILSLSLCHLSVSISPSGTPTAMSLSQKFVIPPEFDRPSCKLWVFPWFSWFSSFVDAVYWR